MSLFPIAVKRLGHGWRPAPARRDFSSKTSPTRRKHPRTQGPGVPIAAKTLSSSTHSISVRWLELDHSSSDGCRSLGPVP